MRHLWRTSLEKFALVSIPFTRLSRSMTGRCLKPMLRNRRYALDTFSKVQGLEFTGQASVTQKAEAFMYAPMLINLDRSSSLYVAHSHSLVCCLDVVSAVLRLGLRV